MNWNPVLFFSFIGAAMVILVVWVFVSTIPFSFSIGDSLLSEEISNAVSPPLASCFTLKVTVNSSPVYCTGVIDISTKFTEPGTLSFITVAPLSNVIDEFTTSNMVLSYFNPKSKPKHSVEPLSLNFTETVNSSPNSKFVFAVSIFNSGVPVASVILGNSSIVININNIMVIYFSFFFHFLSCFIMNQLLLLKFTD